MLIRPEGPLGVDERARAKPTVHIFNGLIEAERGNVVMTQRLRSKVIAALVVLSGAASTPILWAPAQGETSKQFEPPIVFQAAGPSAESIQGTVDEFRAALGNPNNGNAPGPLAVGRREINWDGGSTNNQATAIAGNPFSGFLITRGALFTTPHGTGFVQAPPAADPALFPPGGLAGVF
ncbi:MAG TPA: hypothetical protein VKD72_00330, partial [Gemmataceae bacterium]|nr:hypothetical protein [Gemmataceae bacterium]